MKKQGKRGAPPQKYDEKLTSPVYILMTPSQREKLSALSASNDGASMADVVRTLIERAPIDFTVKTSKNE